MGSFMSSLFGGQNTTLNSDINKSGQIGGFSTGLGESNLTASSKFFKDLLSGDPSQIAKSLGPEIAGVQGQKQQQLNATAQFGNRSGGNNASNQMANDKATGSINGMISSLLGGAANSLAGIGGNALNTGLNATSQQADLSQIQMANWENSILGKGITSGVAAGESAGLGAAKI